MNEEDRSIDAEILEDDLDATATQPEPEPEPGSLPARFGALCLDLILVTAIFALFLTQFVFPTYYPGAMDELMEQFDRSGEETEPVEPSENVLEAIRTSNMISIVFVFAYFSFLPALAGGGTLGMRIFNLRIQDQNESVPAPLRSHLIRGSIKTICLQVLFPFLTLLFLYALRTRNRIALHDLLAKTRVVRGASFKRP